MNEVPFKTKAAIEDLLRVAEQEKVTIAGFAFSFVGPSFVNFGNCNDSGDIKLFTELCRLKDEKTRSGQVVHESVRQVV